MEKSYLERRSLYWNGANCGGHLHRHYFGVIWSWLSFIPLIFRVRVVSIVSTPNHQIHCGFHCYRHNFSRSPCTVLTAGKLLAVRAVQWNCQWPLAMGGNSHQSREPTIYCDWGNSNQYRTNHKRAMPAYVSHSRVHTPQPHCHRGLYSLSGKTSYRQISWSLEAARLGVIIIAPLWNLTGTSAALLPRGLSNFRAIGKV